jgi:hypothetical protein
MSAVAGEKTLPHGNPGEGWRIECALVARVVSPASRKAHSAD